MNDSKIRKAVHSRMIRHYHRNPNALVVDELGIHHGRSRIDIAIINGRLSGYEIKSELDDLSRLQGQSDAYSSVFSHLTLVVADKFLRHAMELLPTWWGIVSVKQGIRGGVILQKIRIPKQNPLIDTYAIAKLLWKEEAIELLKTKGIHGKILRSNRKELYKKIADTMDISELETTVCNVLKQRQNWRDQLQL